MHQQPFALIWSTFFCLLGKPSKDKHQITSHPSCSPSLFFFFPSSSSSSIISSEGSDLSSSPSSSSSLRGNKIRWIPRRAKARLKETNSSYYNIIASGWKIYILKITVSTWHMAYVWHMAYRWHMDDRFGCDGSTPPTQSQVAVFARTLRIQSLPWLECFPHWNKVVKLRRIQLTKKSQSFTLTMAGWVNTMLAGIPT